MGAMSNLIFEPNGVSLTRETLDPLREELAAGGLLTGLFSIGDIHSSPEMVYFLWHESGEAPVSMWMRRDSFSTDAATRAAARDFLTQWRGRL